MQRCSRPTAFRPQISPIVSNPISAKAKRSWGKLMSLTLCVALTASGAGVALSGGKTTGKNVAVQGHAKRYMRINEYLFHGTQKGTAIAARFEDKSTQQV